MSVAATLAATARRLREAGIEAPQREARLLLAEASGLPMTALVTHGDQPMEVSAEARLASMLARRAAHEPLSRIVGRREFWSLEFGITPATLDPRPDTETVVEAALAILTPWPPRGGEGESRSPEVAARYRHPPHPTLSPRVAGGERKLPCRILDLGTGSGCILLALLSALPDAVGIGADRSEQAARVARDNAHRLGFADRARFVVGDWAGAIDARFDLVVSNPPYISSGAIDRLDDAVRLFDPRPALDGGADGLDAYRALAAGLDALLAPDGVGVFELGAGQHQSVPALFEAAGLTILDRRRDLAGIARALVVGRVRDATRNPLPPK